MNGEKTVAKKGREWLKRETRPYRNAVIFLTSLTVISTALSLAFAYLTRYLVNSAAVGDSGRLAFFSAVLLAVLLARIALQTAQNYCAEKQRARITVGLRDRLFLRLLHADYAGSQNYHTGDVLTRLTTDVSEIASDTVGLMPAIAGMFVQAAGAIAALLTLDPVFTGVFVVGGIAVGGAAAFFRKKSKKYHKEVVESDGANRAFMQESFSSALTVKAYGAEERAAEKSRGFLRTYYRKRMQRNRLNACMNGAFSLVSNAAFIFALVWCGLKILRGSTDYGAILSVVLLLGQLQRPFASFSSILPARYAQAASAERLSEIDALPAETESGAGEPFAYEDLAAIRLENLSFDYGRERLFSNACAAIEKGETVCVTGGSGCGKSTLFKLLLGVYAPTGGGAYLERKKAGKGETDALIPISSATRNLFAYVPQGNFLFSGTIYENLAFFCEETDGSKLNEKIRTALVSACAEFVYELPEGLNTPLRERGGGLSEGQLQRLAVARALLSERPVLLLDEATSALDGETEKRLLENIRNTAGKTCLIVTHRPAALAIADKVLRVGGGKIETQKISAKGGKVNG